MGHDVNLETKCRESGRIVASLDGTWEIADSVSAEEMPKEFSHTVPVPGLAHSATPAFPDVDLWESYEYMRGQVGRGLRPKEDMPEGIGVSRQERNYFWYRRTFRCPGKRQTYLLKVNKAQFGFAVWINGRFAGEHPSCFTSATFDVTDLVDPDGENTIVIRIGAHRGAFPEHIPSGTDSEKARWTPGIYDSVSLIASDNPVVETVQVAPRISDGSILMETVVKNHAAAPVEYALTQSVKTWKDGVRVAEAPPELGRLAAGEERVIRQRIEIPDARLWSPDDPFLYVLETSTGGDRVATRFGMREFRFDTATRRAYLNGQMIFLRGSNITLHRFIEDPLSGTLPWDEAWVRKLLVDLPRRLHWNAFRVCIGPTPDFWLDIADEAGLLIQWEYPIWTGRGGWKRLGWDTNAVTNEFKAWMRDSWNHPSVVIWDAANETDEKLLGEVVIPAVRGLDLSNRPWDNGYGLPSGPDDPVEDHPYLFTRNLGNKPGTFTMQHLEKMVGTETVNAPYPTAHASIINEYGWLWLNRDGSPTLLTEEVWEQLLPGGSAEQRLKMNAYLLAGLTEFWRTRRTYAGVLHFVYLTCSYPGTYTCDNFKDIRNLELHSDFLDYMSEAFKPLGLCLSFWREEVARGASLEIPVVMINDYTEGVEGTLEVWAEDDAGVVLASYRRPFALPAFGQHTWLARLNVPGAGEEGKAPGGPGAPGAPDTLNSPGTRGLPERTAASGWIKALARIEGAGSHAGRSESPTLCRRRVRFSG